MLYIMRHAKTDWNITRRMQGRTNIPLNDEGREMARLAREECMDIHFDACYCSPLARARETAEILLSGRDVPIIFDDRLMEMSFGIYEGTANCLSIPNHPMQVLFDTPELYTPVEGGESLDEVFARTADFLNEVIYPQLELGRDILIMAHGAVNSALINTVRGNSKDKFWSEHIENCKLTRLL